MPEEVTEQQLKHTFFKNVIQTQDTVRLVAHAPNMDGNSTGPATPIEIFVPTSPDDDYDLVLSLCADGTQRLTLDFDLQTYSDRQPVDVLEKWYELSLSEMGLLIPRAGFVTPSTSNWHLWGDAQIHWTAMQKMLGLACNPGYLEMNRDKGFCSLRPPWKNKYDMTFHDSFGFRFNRKPDRGAFHGFDWVGPKEQGSEGQGWDDLGWDE